MAEQNPTVVATDDPALASKLGLTAYDADAGQYVTPAAADGEPVAVEQPGDEPVTAEQPSEVEAVGEPSEQPEPPVFS